MRAWTHSELSRTVSRWFAVIVMPGSYASGARSRGPAAAQPIASPFCTVPTMYFWYSTWLLSIQL
jgi:hypothetical protein